MFLNKRNILLVFLILFFNIDLYAKMNGYILGKPSKNALKKSAKKATPGSTTSKRAAGSSGLNIGIVYNLQHCSSARGEASLDIAKIMANIPLTEEQSKFEAVFPHTIPEQNYWWGKPDLGYYCLANGSDILTQHAKQIYDLAIDFIIVDFTNWPDYNPYYDDRRHLIDSETTPAVVNDAIWAQNQQTKIDVILPFENLLNVWNSLSNAPKIVPWVPITGGSSMINYIKNKLNEKVRADSEIKKYANLLFMYEEKPLMLAPGYQQMKADPSNADKLIGALPPFANSAPQEPPWNQFNAAKIDFTLRKMWNLLPTQTYDRTFNSTPPTIDTSEHPTNPGIDKQWANVQSCADEDGFKASAGNSECNQPVGHDSTLGRGFPIETISATTAYQKDYASHTETATPKFKGKTIVRQLQTAWKKINGANAPQFLLLANWNEWTATRQVPGAPYPFVDQYDVEYNRDIEPGGGLSAYYYYLTKNAVELLLSNQDPINALTNVKFEPYKIIGFIDELKINSNNDEVITGWTCRKNDFNPIKIQIYVGGDFSSGGTFAGQFTTNVRNEDIISELCQSTGTLHRFEIPTKDFQNRAALRGDVYIYAQIDVNSIPQNIKKRFPEYAKDSYLLTNSDPTKRRISLQAPGTPPTNLPPIGVADFARDGILQGWAYDPDDLSRSIDVHIYVGNPAGSGAPVIVIKAESVRADVNAALNITGNHGIRFEIPAEHRVNGKIFYLYAIDSANPNINTPLNQVTYGAP